MLQGELKKMEKPMKINSVILLAVLGLAVGCANNSTKESKTPVQIVEAKKEVPQAQTPATQAKPTSIDIFVCSRDSDVREIYIEPIIPLGCKLWYSNYRTGKPAAWSDKGLGYCEEVNENIRSNLQNAGFKCQAVSKSPAIK